MNTYDMDWDAMAEQANNIKGKHEYTEKSKSSFLKVPPGMHHLRIIPTGNATERLPYVKIVQHQANYKDEQGSFRYGFVLCWKAVMDNLAKKQSEEDKKTKSHISYLGAVKLLDQINYRLYVEHGCPFCKVNQYLNMHGADKQVTSKFWANESYHFNVIWRATHNSGDNGVYVWKLSKQKFNLVINSIKIAKFELGGQDLLHPESGQDILMQAEGQGLSRRYPIIQFTGMPSPLNLGDRVPHDLMDAIGKSYRPYQDAVNLLKKWYGKILINYGYTIPGDQLISEQYQGVSSIIDSVGINKAVDSVTPTYVPPVGANVVSNRKMLPGGYYEENGMLYKPDGTPAF